MPTYAPSVLNALTTENHSLIPFYRNMCEYCQLLAPGNMIACEGCQQYFYCSTACKEQDAPVHDQGCGQCRHFKIVETAGPSNLSAFDQSTEAYIARRPNFRDTSRAVNVIANAHTTRGLFLLISLAGVEFPGVSAQGVFASLRQVQYGCIPPELLFVVRQLSWQNMPMELREYSSPPRAVEWGDKNQLVSKTGILVQFPNPRVAPTAITTSFQEWYQEVSQTFAPNLQDMLISTL